MTLPVTATAAVAAPQLQVLAPSAPPAAPANAPIAFVAPATPVPVPVVSAPAVSQANGSAPTKSAIINDSAKLKVEVLRLEGLVKKLQSELQAEREYSRALEAHVKTLQEAD
jgi:hypothetical protein